MNNLDLLSFALFINNNNMSDIKKCPKCGGKAKYQIKGEEETYTAVQDEEAFKKIEQLKKAMTKFKTKSEQLEKELIEMKNKATD